MQTPAPNPALANSYLELLYNLARANALAMHAIRHIMPTGSLSLALAP